jgi:hypothetical protein
VREAYEKRAQVFYKGYYGQLEGCTIVKYLGMQESNWGAGFPTFLVRYPDNTECEIEVSCDEEGNGGGFLFLPYEPNMEEYDKTNKLNKYKESA